MKKTDSATISAEDNKALMEETATDEPASEDADRKSRNEIAKLKAQLAEANAKLAGKDKAVPSGDDYEGENPRQMVRIQLFKDNERYSRDLYVMINGVPNQLPRGVVVTVPYYVYMAIKESATQDAATIRLIEQTAKALNADIPELS